VLFRSPLQRLNSTPYDLGRQMTGYFVNRHWGPWKCGLSAGYYLDAQTAGKLPAASAKYWIGELGGLESSRVPFWFVPPWTTYRVVYAVVRWLLVLLMAGAALEWLTRRKKAKAPQAEPPKDGAN
jgi:hypothetical protein